jgi:acetone carboxylase gamma subunit
MDKQRKKRGVLEEIFNIQDPGEQDPFFRHEKPARRPKRPWVKNREECPECGSLYPVGGSCPGCGLHHDEMKW